MFLDDEFQEKNKTYGHINVDFGFDHVQEAGI